MEVRSKRLGEQARGNEALDKASVRIQTRLVVLRREPKLLRAARRNLQSPTADELDPETSAPHAK